jgi:hypothetical protein
MRSICHQQGDVGDGLAHAPQPLMYTQPHTKERKTQIVASTVPKEHLGWFFIPSKTADLIRYSIIAL